MKKPNCPCWGCENHTPTCKRECEAFACYEKAYKEFEEYRKKEFLKRDATIQKSHSRWKYSRIKLMDRKRGIK